MGNAMSTLVENKPAPELEAEYTAFIERNGMQNAYKSALKGVENFNTMTVMNQREVMCTGGVKPNVQLKLLQRKLKAVCDKAVLITIDAKLPKLMCFQNSFFVEEARGWEKQAGFNITACPCGGHMCLEMHSVNRNDEGKYVDWTIDFAGESRKWFMPIKTRIPAHVLMSTFGIRGYSIGQSRCRCASKFSLDFEDIDAQKLAGVLDMCCKVNFLVM